MILEMRFRSRDERAGAASRVGFVSSPGNAKPMEHCGTFLRLPFAHAVFVVALIGFDWVCFARPELVEGPALSLSQAPSQSRRATETILADRAFSGILGNHEHAQAPFRPQLRPADGPALPGRSRRGKKCSPPHPSPQHPAGPTLTQIDPAKNRPKATPNRPPRLPVPSPARPRVSRGLAHVYWAHGLWVIAAGFVAVS